MTVDKMTVDKMIVGLQKLSQKGYGDLEIIAVHVNMARGETYFLDQNLRVAVPHEDHTLFGAVENLTENEEYVTIYLT